MMVQGRVCVRGRARARRAKRRARAKWRSSGVMGEARKPGTRQQHDARDGPAEGAPVVGANPSDGGRRRETGPAAQIDVGPTGAAGAVRLQVQMRVAAPEYEEAERLYTTTIEGPRDP